MKLKRICKRCEKTFQPTGKYEYVCEGCRAKRMAEAYEKRKERHKELKRKGEYFIWQR